MPTVIGHHDVKDTGALARVAEARGVLRPSRSHEHPDVRRPAEPKPRRRADGRTRHGRLVMAAMESRRAAEAMAHDGVLPETVVILVEADNVPGLFVWGIIPDTGPTATTIEPATDARRDLSGPRR